MTHIRLASHASDRLRRLAAGWSPDPDEAGDASDLRARLTAAGVARSGAILDFDAALRRPGDGRRLRRDPVLAAIVRVSAVLEQGCGSIWAELFGNFYLYCQKATPFDPSTCDTGPLEVAAGIVVVP